MKISFFVFKFLIIFVAYSAIMVKIGIEFNKQKKSNDYVVLEKSIDGCRWLVEQKNKKLSACMQKN